MTNPTDPRIEAAARALCAAAGYDPSGDSITPVNNPEMDVNWEVYAPDAEIALKAADEAAWLPIESAPKDGTQILAFDGAYQELVTWERGKWWCDPGMEFLPITWQPLPTPPETR